MEEFKNTGQFFFLSPLSYFSFLILPSSSLSLFLLLKYNFPILSSLSLFSYIFFSNSFLHLYFLITFCIQIFPFCLSLYLLFKIYFTNSFFLFSPSSPVLRGGKSTSKLC